jgi:hypothetical protein
LSDEFPEKKERWWTGNKQTNNGNEGLRGDWHSLSRPQFIEVQCNTFLRNEWK